MDYLFAVCIHYGDWFVFHGNEKTSYIRGQMHEIDKCDFDMISISKIMDIMIKVGVL